MNKRQRKKRQKADAWWVIRQDLDYIWFNRVYRIRFPAHTSDASLRADVLACRRKYRPR